MVELFCKKIKWLSQRHRDTEMNENEIGTIIVDCAIHLRRVLDPGNEGFRADVIVEKKV